MSVMETREIELSVSFDATAVKCPHCGQLFPPKDGELGSILSSQDLLRYVVGVDTGNSPSVHPGAVSKLQALEVTNPHR